MRRVLVAAALAAAWVAAPAQAQLGPVPLPMPTPEPTPTPTPPAEPTPAGGQVPPVVEPPPPGLSAVAAGQDATRSGSSGDATLAGPLGLAWTVGLPDRTTAIVTGGGRVYVARSSGDQSSSNRTTTVDALDAATGRRLWSSPGASALAYGDERIAVVTADSLRVLDAATGALVWQTTSSTFGEDVLIAAGTVFHRAEPNSPLAARSLVDGSPLWARATDGTSGRPAVAGDRLFTAGPCRAGAYDRRTGALLWEALGGCSSGGGGGPAVLWRDRVFPLGDGGDIGAVSAADGAKVGGPLPSVVTGDVGVVTGARLAAVRLPGGEPLWDAPGVAALGLPGSVMTRDARGGLTLRDAVTGAPRWSARVRGVSAPQGSSTDTPVLGPVAGEGRVFVAAGSRLLALAPATATTPAATALRSTVGFAGRPFRVRGAIAGPLLPPTTELQLRVGRAWRTVARAAPGAQGLVRPRVTLRRNARARLIGPGVRPSRPVVLYAQPPVTQRVTVPATGQARAAVRLAAVPGLRRAGRRVALYTGPRRTGTFRRAGVARLGASGRGALRFTPAAGPGGRFFTASCLVGARRIGLGAPDPLTRRCGAARITLRR